MSCVENLCQVKCIFVHILCIYSVYLTFIANATNWLLAMQGLSSGPSRAGPAGPGLLAVWLALNPHWRCNGILAPVKGGGGRENLQALAWRPVRAYVAYASLWRAYTLREYARNA